MKPSKHQDQLDAQVSRVASLGEPVRRTLYRFVVAQPEPVNREQAAAGVNVAHHVAKFHLDKLEDDGLLEVEYRRPPGKTGPGAGRPAKFYRRADADIEVSLPERRYDLAGHLMAEAITNSEAAGTTVSSALQRAAKAAGRRLGKAALAPAGQQPRPAAVIRTVCEVLDENGYEPNAAAACITLANCPFHSLAADYTDLICGMNLELITGLLDALDQGTLQAQLAPAPDRCCVTITGAAAKKSKRR